MCERRMKIRRLLAAGAAARFVTAGVVTRLVTAGVVTRLVTVGLVALVLAACSGTGADTDTTNKESEVWEMTQDESQVEEEDGQSGNPGEEKDSTKKSDMGQGEDSTPEADMGQGEDSTKKSDMGQGEDSTEEADGQSELAWNAARAFYKEELSEAVKVRITGISYPADDRGAKISYEELSYVHVLYYDFSGAVQEGELVCNRAIADDLVDIFRKLYESEYPIEKIRLVDEYGGDDDASMADNNTSCFNYRTVAGTNRLSKHSYGLAVDVNPLYNPYVTTRNGRTVIMPEAGAPYADRGKSFDYKIDRDDLCYRLFVEHGFTWGGSWQNSKDYQHFEKAP